MYGSVRTVVWQGSVGDRSPYADLTGYPEFIAVATSEKTETSEVVPTLGITQYLWKTEIREIKTDGLLRTSSGGANLPE